MARRKSNSLSDESGAGPSFEDALAGLEDIVEAMENGHLPLEDLVAHYERGSALLKHCEGILQSAKTRIELITLRNQEPLEETTAAPADEAPARQEGVEESDDDDDIRLF
ncbi:MAG: exodeoxyribonuclease VII small subunit [Verrucomicrobia bacterium]|nr:exodeoxyribonuclease VII small subunit [Verrucomicrobiota bacterium]